jgi:hypothetical protein
MIHEDLLKGGGEREYVKLIWSGRDSEETKGWNVQES